NVEGIAVDTWVPLLPAPEWKLGGTLTAEIEFNTSGVKELLLMADLSGKSAKSGLYAGGQVLWRLAAAENSGPDLHTTEFTVNSVTIPLSGAHQLVGALKQMGVVVNGTLK